MSARATRRRMRSWGRRQLYSFFSSLGALVSHRLGTLMTSLVLGIAVLLPLGLYVTVDNLRGLDLQRENWGTVTVFLQADAGAEEAMDLAALIGREHAATVTVVTPEQGLAEFQQASGFGQAMELFDENPLPWVLQVTVQSASGEAIEPAVRSISEWLDGQDVVDSVQADFKWLQRLAGLLALGDAFVTVLTVLFSLAMVVVVANTIRLDVANRAQADANTGPSLDTSLIRLPGNTAMTRCASIPSSDLACAVSRSAGVRSAIGWPTNSAATACRS